MKTTPTVLQKDQIEWLGNITAVGNSPETQRYCSHPLVLLNFCVSERPLLHPQNEPSLKTLSQSP